MSFYPKTTVRQYMSTLNLFIEYSMTSLKSGYTCKTILQEMLRYSTPITDNKYGAVKKRMFI